MHVITFLRTCFFLSRVVIVVLALCVGVNATGNEVDLSYGGVPSRDLESDDGKLVLQPDGKILIYGDFQLVNGVPKLRFARLNSDGTLDNSFNFDSSGYTFISKVLVQADGKILVSGSTAHPYPKIVRLNPNGSVDGSFTSPWNGSQSEHGATVFAVQADGKMYAGKHTSGFHLIITSLYRLNSDGTIDDSFAPIGFEGWFAKHFLMDVISLPGSQILIAGRHTNGTVFRVNSDGTKDNSFESPLLGSSQFSIAESVARQSDGKVLFTGEFTTVNGITRSGITRLNADGTMDLQFPESGFGGGVRVLANDKIIVGALRRLNSDGTLDNTFTPPPSLNSVNSWQVDGLERVVLFCGFFDGSTTTYQFFRLNTDGSLDLTFNPLARLAATVYLLASQSDGKTIVHGNFTQMNGVSRRNYARLDVDGALDPTFDVGTFNASPNTITVQSNGQVLLGGFAELFRLEPNGSVDATFTPTVDSHVSSIAVQPDNKILIGGAFTVVNGPTRRLLARLNSNGTTDASFNPLFGTGSIFSIVVQNDNRIIVGGTFSGVSGIARSNIARLNADGSVDTSFNAGSIATVARIVLQPDGKYIVVTDTTIRRLNIDGSTDNTFQSPTLGAFSVKALILQADGSMVIAGSFGAVNGVVRPNLARLNSIGQLDVGFLPNGTNGFVNGAVMQPSGKIVIGGSFTSVNNIPRAAMARLTTVPFVRTVLFDFDGDGKADVSVYRPSNNYWYLSRSSDSQFTYHYFGTTGDIPTPADYDGDGKSDLAIFRPSSGDWWYQSSISGVFTGVHWGSNGDIPRPSDVDGDGRADYVVYHPANNTWYRLSSGNGQASERYFGAPGDKPLVGDFDGDGKSDPAIFRPSTGVFWYMSSINSAQRAIPWGTGTDIPAPADYDGDGKTDAAVYRPSTGFWYIYFSSNGSYSFTNFGIAEDRPIPADYDGDGKADIAVYRPSTGTWYMLRSTAGFSAQQFGNSTDVPTPNAFVPSMP